MLLWILVIIGVITLDQVSKLLAVAFLKEQTRLDSRPLVFYGGQVMHVSCDIHEVWFLQIS